MPVDIVCSRTPLDIGSPYAMPRAHNPRPEALSIARGGEWVTRPVLGPRASVVSAASLVMLRGRPSESVWIRSSGSRASNVSTMDDVAAA